MTRQATSKEILGVDWDYPVASTFADERGSGHTFASKAKVALPFTLASDEDGKTCEAYGTWVEKSMYGRKYMGIDRATFLIDEAGVLRAEWRKVKVPGHVEEVLAAARRL